MYTTTATLGLSPMYTVTNVVEVIVTGTVTVRKTVLYMVFVCTEVVVVFARMELVVGGREVVVVVEVFAPVWTSIGRDKASSIITKAAALLKLSPRRSSQGVEYKHLAELCIVKLAALVLYSVCSSIAYEHQLVRCESFDDLRSISRYNQRYSCSPGYRGQLSSNALSRQRI